MRKSLVLLLAIAATGIVLGGYFLLRDTLRTRLFVSRATEIVISNIDKDEIVEMTLRNADGSLAMRRQAEGWVEEPPAVVALDQQAVEDIAWSFSRLSAERIVSEKPGALDRFGLAPPRAVAGYRLLDGSGKRFSIGSAVRGGKSFYLLVEGDSKLYQVGNGQVERFLRAPRDLRRGDP